MGNLGLDSGSIEKIAVKALVGGLISQAATGDFATGALAAGANEALVEHLAGLVDHDPQLLGMASLLVGAVSAGLTGGDARLAADIAGYDTAYNYLNHVRPRMPELSEKERYDNAAAACNAGDAGACRTRDELMLLSQQRDRELASACMTDQTQCNRLIGEARAMGNLVYGQGFRSYTHCILRWPAVFQELLQSAQILFDLRLFRLHRSFRWLLRAWPNNAY